MTDDPARAGTDNRFDFIFALSFKFYKCKSSEIM
jgi:hypothetical protein